MESGIKPVIKDTSNHVIIGLLSKTEDIEETFITNEGKSYKYSAIYQDDETTIMITGTPLILLVNISDEKELKNCFTFTKHELLPELSEDLNAKAFFELLLLTRGKDIERQYELYTEESTYRLRHISALELELDNPSFVDSYYESIGRKELLQYGPITRALFLNDTIHQVFSNFSINHDLESSGKRRYFRVSNATREFGLSGQTERFEVTVDLDDPESQYLLIDNVLEILHLEHTICFEIYAA